MIMEPVSVTTEHDSQTTVWATCDQLMYSMYLVELHTLHSVD